MIRTQYERVIPRDLFNEAKLLKCMGHLSVKILDNATPVNMECIPSESEPFIIGLMDEGSLTITNMSVLIRGKQYRFKTTYNSKAIYPLYVDYQDCDYLVFDEFGNWDKEFLDFINSLK